MLTCNCTLPYLNPDACKSCPAWIKDQMEMNKPIDGINYPAAPYVPWNPNDFTPEPKKVKRVTKTIDKYGPQGQYIGREIITEEIEEVDRYVWSAASTYGVNLIYNSTVNPFPGPNTLTNNPPFFETTNTTRLTGEEQISYTNSNNGSISCCVN